MEEPLGLLLVLVLLQSTNGIGEYTRGWRLPYMFCQARELSMLPCKGAVGAVQEIISFPC